MLNVHQIALGYNGTPLIQDLTFSLEQGQVCAVIGHNGSGKSTLMRTLLGVQPPLSGRIDWHDVAPDGHPRNIAYLGQSTDLDHQFPMRVKDAVAMGAWQGLGFWTGIDQAKADRIDYALARTGLTEMADKPLYACSSGQIQRCFFARAIVQDTPVLLLDEPFSTIDQTTQSRLVEIIKEWRQEGRGLMIVLHDLSAVMGIADTCLLLGDGRASFGQAEDIITIDNLIAHHYLSETQAEWLTLLQQKGVQNV